MRIEIEVRCDSCNEPLETIHEWLSEGRIFLTVTPCSNCIQIQVEEPKPCRGAIVGATSNEGT